MKLSFEPEYCLLAINGDCAAGGMSDHSHFIPIKWQPGSDEAQCIKLYLRNQLEIDLEHFPDPGSKLVDTHAPAFKMTKKLLELIGWHHELGNQLIDCGVFLHKWHKRTTWMLVELDAGKPCWYEGTYTVELAS
tara:strand:- start:45 stop:446 length:402 start_codon:yes stop_codon:yes gene_type:complete